MKQLNWYQIFGQTHTIPDGRTVTPTDDIQIWLNCADIWDKTYTTLAEVLADTDTLLALINSNNAVDYMVRSTTWAVAQALVPVMTSDTTPSGVCSCSHEGAQPWYAFDGDDTTRMTLRPSSISYEWVGYEFETPQSVRKIKDLVYGSINTRVSSAKLQYSSDGNTWNDIQTFSDYKNSSSHEYAISTSQTAKYWRIYLSFNAADFVGYYTIQFYGESITNSSTAMSYIGLNNYCANTLLADSTWCMAIANSTYIESVLNVKVPTMTSETAPSGVVSASGYYYNVDNMRPYHAFDGDTSKVWQSQPVQVSSTQWIKYKFPKAVRIYAFFLVTTGSLSNPYRYYKGKLQASNDDSDYSQETAVITNGGTDTPVGYLTNYPSAYMYYRLWTTQTNYYPTNETSDARTIVKSLQLYGREDV